MPAVEGEGPRRWPIHTVIPVFISRDGRRMQGRGGMNDSFLWLQQGRL